MKWRNADRRVGPTPLQEGRDGLQDLLDTAARLAKHSGVAPRFWLCRAGKTWMFLFSAGGRAVESRGSSAEEAVLEGLLQWVAGSGDGKVAAAP